MPRAGQDLVKEEVGFSEVEVSICADTRRGLANTSIINLESVRNANASSALPLQNFQLSFQLSKSLTTPLPPSSLIPSVSLLESGSRSIKDSIPKFVPTPLPRSTQYDPRSPYIPRTPLAVFAAKKKYKPVAKKVRPVMAELPERFRIVRSILGDPLATLPELPTNPPSFQPNGRYTRERKEYIDKAHPGDFLWPAERELMHYFMCIHQDGFAWSDTERGHFREDFFPPIEIPTIPHKPWVVHNIPIPPGIYKNVCDLIQRKIDAGVFEPSNSSYRS